MGHAFKSFSGQFCKLDQGYFKLYQVFFELALVCCAESVIFMQGMKHGG